MPIKVLDGRANDAQRDVEGTLKVACYHGPRLHGGEYLVATAEAWELRGIGERGLVAAHTITLSKARTPGTGDPIAIQHTRTDWRPWQLENKNGTS